MRLEVSCGACVVETDTPHGGEGGGVPAVTRGADTGTGERVRGGARVPVRGGGGSGRREPEPGGGGVGGAGVLLVGFVSGPWYWLDVRWRFVPPTDFPP